MKIAADKAGHLKAGALICCFVAVLCIAVGCGLQSALIIGSSASLIIGIIKEAWDHFHPKEHRVETWDAAATWIGGLSVTAFIALVRWMAI